MHGLPEITHMAAVLSGSAAMAEDQLCTLLKLRKLLCSSLAFLLHPDTCNLIAFSATGTCQAYTQSWHMLRQDPLNDVVYWTSRMAWGESPYLLLELQLVCI